MSAFDSHSPDTLLKLRLLEDADQKDLLRWRNQPEVRRVMLNTRPIGEQEHADWWRRTRDDPSRRWYVLERSGVPLAVIDYFALNEKKREGWWGFYLTDQAPEAGRFALWADLEKLALQHAYEVLGLRRLWCETRASNTPVLAMHERFGFQRMEERLLPGEPGEHLIVMCAQAKSAQPLRIAFLGSANWDLAGAEFEQRWPLHAGGHALALRLPFGQYRLQLADTASPLHLQAPEMLVFAERLEDLMPDSRGVFHPGLADELRVSLDAYLDVIEQARDSLPGLFLVMDLAPLHAYPVDCALESGADPLVDLLHAMNRHMSERLAPLPDIHILPLSRLLQRHGSLNADPGRYWQLGRIPFSDNFTRALVDHLCGVLLARQGRGVRVIALDLDGTLWRGILGEEGLSGIQVGGDYPGSAHSVFQNLLLALRRRGVLLCICSKNDADNALQAVDAHPGMSLRRKDFAAWRIDWSPKPDNLQALAGELGLGLEAFCFIDDSPHEREEMRRRLPQVLVPELPAMVEDWPALLLAEPRMALLPLTAEDRSRPERYRARAMAARDATRYNSREDFLHSLNMRVRIYPLGPGNRQRVLQLLAKTNQFNATTRRHGGRELDALVQQGGEVLAVGLSDRFLSGEDIIGVMLLRYSPGRAVLDTVLLSCRVLGRGVETAMLAWAERRARECACAELMGEIVQTPRNGPVRALYSLHGFTPAGKGCFVLDLQAAHIDPPAWIELA